MRGCRGTLFVVWGGDALREGVQQCQTSVRQGGSGRGVHDRVTSRIHHVARHRGGERRGHDSG